MTLSSILTAILETVLMTFLSTLLAYLIGLPIGIILTVTKKNGLKPNKIINSVLSLIVNILRSIPCLIIIVLCIPISRAVFDRGTGEWYTILVPLTITAFGFVSRMVEQSLNEVESGKIEAIKSLGASDFDIILKVLIPESLSSLLSGLCVVLVSILGYTSFAYNIGGGGLISLIYTFYTRNTGNYMESASFWGLIVLVVLIVELIQEGGLFIAKKIDKRRKLS